MRRSWVAVVALMVLGPLATAGCSDDQVLPGGANNVTPRDASSPGGDVSAFSLTVSPATGATEVPVSAEIGTTVTGGKVTAVTLRESGGAAVSGELRGDGSAWVPAEPLDADQRYEASVTAVDTTGTTRTVTTSFTTMSRPSKRTGTGLYLFDDHTYGVAMPVVVEFHPGIAKKDRAGVQRRMFVETDPPQPGTWHWVTGGRQAYYRAPEFWQPGTRLTVRIALGGHPTGGGRYGDRDRAASARIGRSFMMKVDNATKIMSIIESGKTIRTMPVSLGKKSTPSSSGTMVVMEKKEATVFDTFAELGPRNGYRTEIDFAQRLTWSGQYIHAAAWSVADQGRRNVSHGCVNLSPSNARWLFGRTKVGDPVTIAGTGDPLVPGNGWTAWDMTWAKFAAGSALPVPPELALGRR